MLILSVGSKKVSLPEWGESYSKVFLQSFFSHPYLRWVEKSVPSFKKKNQLDKGFTLLELLVVMTIIGMMAVLIIPNLRTGQATLLRAQVREAIAVLKYARRSAIVEGKQKTVTFHEGKEVDNSVSKTRQGHWVSRGATLQWGEEGDEEDSDTNSETASYQITFYPEGGNSGGVLTLSHLKYKTKISVDPMTGKIELENLYEDD